MIYLSNPWIWLSFWLGFVLIGGFGIPVRRVNLCASSPQGKLHPFRIEIVKLVYIVFLLGGVFLSVEFLRWRLHGLAEPWWPAYVFGSVLGVPLQAWLGLRPQNRRDPKDSNSTDGHRHR